jgi:catechol 2,3-dioxygenase-like lactoylglutathione lyase family enzyme
MFKAKSVFSGFSVNDLKKAHKFYADVLKLKVEDQGMGLRLHLPEGGEVFIYSKDDHKPATFTILNFVVAAIEEAVEELSENGVKFETYKGFGQDDKGIARGIANKKGPDIAWFKDPAGNILSVMQLPVK